METGKNRFFNICEAYQSMLGRSDSVARDARRYKNINESFERTNKICESTEHNFNVDEYLKRVRDNSRFFFTEGGIYKCDDGHTLMQVVDYYSPSNMYTTLFTNGHGLGSADVWAKKAYSHDGEVTVKPTDVDMEMTSRCANMRKMLLDAYYIPGWFMPVLFSFHIEDSENFILTFEKLVKEKPAFEKILLRDEADVARLIEEYPDINSIYGTNFVASENSNGKNESAQRRCAARGGRIDESYDDFDNVDYGDEAGDYSRQWDKYDDMVDEVNAEWEGLGSKTKDTFCERLMYAIGNHIATGRVDKNTMLSIVNDATSYDMSMADVHEVFSKGIDVGEQVTNGRRATAK